MTDPVFIVHQLSDSLLLIINKTKQNIPFLATMLLVFWGAFFLTVLDRRLLYLGLVPRRLHGLTGIFCAPFLHANFNHLFFNTIALLVLSDFLLMHGVAYFLEASIFITIVSGLLIWCFAKPAVHIGASALITGYWGLLVCDAYRQPTITAIILGIISVYYFIGIFYGIFPGKKGVSWEGHLFGLVAGIGANFWLSFLCSWLKIQ